MIKNPSCAFIIRMHYEVDDPRFDWRLAYFQACVLPRIWAQTDRDFDVCVRCNPAHDEIFKKLGCIPFHVRGEYVEYWKAKSGKQFFLDFAPHERIEGLKKYDIQIGLDTDDLIHPDFVKFVKYKCAKAETSLHLSFQPEWFDLKTLEVKRHPIRFTATRGSMIFALYYPNKADYHHAFEVSHQKLHTLVAKSVQVPSGWCWQTIHWQNESTGMTIKQQRGIMSELTKSKSLSMAGETG